MIVNLSKCCAGLALGWAGPMTFDFFSSPAAMLEQRVSCVGFDWRQHGSDGDNDDGEDGSLLIAGI